MPSKAMTATVYTMLLLVLGAAAVFHAVGASRANDIARRRQAIAATPIAEYRARGVSIGEALARLSKLGGVRIDWDTPSLDAVGVARGLPVDLTLFDTTLAQALQVTFDVCRGSQTELAWRWQGDGILVTTAYALAKSSVYRQAYDVSDIKLGPGQIEDPPTLCFSSSSGGGLGGGGGGGGRGLFGGSGAPASQVSIDERIQEARTNLIWLITTTIAPDSWRDAGGTVGSISFLGRHVIVDQTPQQHAQIATLLERLRRESDWP